VRQYQLKSENLFQMWIDQIIQQEHVLHNGRDRWHSLLKNGLCTTGQPSVTLMIMYQNVDFNISDRSKIDEIDPLLIPLRPCMEYYTKQEFSPDIMENVVYHLTSKWRFFVKYITREENCSWGLQFDVMPKNMSRNYQLPKGKNRDDDDDNNNNIIESSPGTAAYFVVMNPLI